MLAILAALAAALPATAAEDCLVIADARSGTMLHREGEVCDERIGPASSFKLTLAVMGYDAGVLVDADTPAWPFDPTFEATRSVERQTTTPRGWMRDSVLWYSREVVRRLGAERFAAYVAAFDYGNRDVSGDPGANNGMTHSWLNRSLLISPMEQMQFVRRLLTGELPVTGEAAALAAATVPVFESGDGWQLHGKTGTGYIREASGKLGKRQFGWFIGWARKGEAVVAFAHLIKDDKAGQSAAGPRARDALVSRWATVGAGL